MDINVAFFLRQLLQAAAKLLKQNARFSVCFTARAAVFRHF
jgi:hypothetical protein